MAGKPRSLKNKTVIITGGGSGVGFECAKTFISHNAKVLIIGRNETKLKNACAELGPQAAYMRGNVAHTGIAEKAMKRAAEIFNRPVDYLINNAGIILRKTAEDTSDTEWADIMAVNVTGVFNFSRAFAKYAHNNGAIINVSSTCGQVGAAGLAAYCASKGAVNQLTRTMALELAARGITVNAVAPGAINSPMLFSQHSDPKMSETVIERNIKTIPTGTIAQSIEIARAILFLAQEKHITGTILTIDGGYTA